LHAANITSISAPTASDAEDCVGKPEMEGVPSAWPVSLEAVPRDLLVASNAMPTFRVAWQAVAGFDEINEWSAIVVADTEDAARGLVWSRITSQALRPEELSVLDVEELPPGLVHVQKGSLWGEPWSVELMFEPRLETDQLSFLARRLARFEMTQNLAGETPPTLRLTVPAGGADEARARAIGLVRDALADGEAVRVMAGDALPVWVWERYALDTT
jgi:hypothetical protein